MTDDQEAECLSPGQEERTPRRGLLAALLIVALGLYPALIFLGLEYAGGRWMGIGVLLLATLRAVLSPGVRGGARALTLGGVLLSLVGGATVVITGNEDLLLYFPAVCSALGGLVLVHSALHERESLIERLARLQRGVDVLPPTAARYCRRLTWTWASFLFLNSGVIAVLAATASPATWALYSGFISYLLAGGLMLIELVYRYWKVKPVADREARALGLID